MFSRYNVLSNIQRNSQFCNGNKTGCKGYNSCLLGIQVFFNQSENVMEGCKSSSYTHLSNLFVTLICHNQLLNFLQFTSKHLDSQKSLPVCYPNMIKGLLITGKINIPYLSGISGGLKRGNLLKM